MKDRAATGVEGLDEVLGGGFPEGSLILLAGNPGTGKTVFSTQFLVKGADLGEPGLYVSLAESKGAFLKNLSRHLAVDLAKLEARGELKVLDFLVTKSEGPSTTLESILEEIEAFKARRLVIDPFSALAQGFKTAIEVRIILHALLSRIVGRMGVTAILVGEVPAGEPKIGFGFEEFVADGVIVLKARWFRGRLLRELEIRKLRGVELAEPKLVFTLKDGFKAFPPFKPKPVGKPSRFKPIPDPPGKFSTGVKDLDAMLGGGVNKGGSILLEVGGNVSTSEYHLIAAPLVENFLAQGRGCWVIPSGGVDYEALKQGTLSYGFSEEEFQNLVLIFDYSPASIEAKIAGKPNLVRLEGADARKDFKVIAEALTKLMDRTGYGPPIASIGVDTLIAFYGEEECEKILNVGMAHNRCLSSLTLFLVKGGREALAKRMSAVADVHLRLTKRNGCLLLYGVKPRTGLHAVEMDTSMGYPLPKLTPIV